MATHTVNFETGQMQYIMATSDDGNLSARVRELVEKGIEVEKDE